MTIREIYILVYFIIFWNWFNNFSKMFPIGTLDPHTKHWVISMHYLKNAKFTVYFPPLHFYLNLHTNQWPRATNYEYYCINTKPLLKTKQTIVLSSAMRTSNTDSLWEFCLYIKPEEGRITYPTSGQQKKTSTRLLGKIKGTYKKGKRTFPSSAQLLLLLNC